MEHLPCQRVPASVSTVIDATDWRFRPVRPRCGQSRGFGGAGPQSPEWIVIASALCALGITERAGTDLGHQGTRHADRSVCEWIKGPVPSTAGESWNGASAGLALGALHPAGGDQGAVGPRLGARGARQSTRRLRLLTGHLNDQPALLALVPIERHCPCRAVFEDFGIRALVPIAPPIGIMAGRNWSHDGVPTFPGRRDGCKDLNDRAPPGLSTSGTRSRRMRPGGQGSLSCRDVC